MTILPHRHRLLLRYLLAVAATAAAALVTTALQSSIGPGVTPPFILAVAVAALYGGRGPGLLAALLSAMVLSRWFLPAWALRTSTDLARLVLFAVVAAIIAWIVGTVHGQRWLAVGQARENQSLKEAAEEATAEAEMAAQDAADALVLQLDAERALRRSEGELADFFDNASTPLHSVGPDGTILRANQAELDMLGYERDEYVGRHVADFHVDRSAIDDILARLQAGETIHNYPARLRRRDGSIRDVLIDSSAYRVDGRLVHTRSFTRDVTVEKQAREAMARLAALVASSSDAIISKTLDGIITSWNAAAERIFGYSAAEMVGQSVFRLIPEELHDSERFVLDQVRKGEPVALSESERVRKDGTRIWISLSVSPVRDASGAVIGAASIKRDVTEARRVAEQLREAQRLQAVGQLAGGIAHEANNQMTVVLGGAQFLLRHPSLPPDARRDIEFIRQAAERTAAITQQLLAFSRRQVLQPQDVDLNRVVESIAPVLGRSLAEDHELVLRLDLGDGLVRADPRQLEQVLLNLALNARDAMPDGGRLTVATCEATPTAEARGQMTGSPTGRYAALVVADTGHGMDAPTMRQAFEPFFTTKDVGLGTGLGLSVVHGIVSQSGGHVRVDSEPGNGSTFTVYFPIVSGGRTAEPATAATPRRFGHGKVALLVEDDVLVRAMAARGLSEAGYAVLEAGHGRAALELARKHPGPLDILITDIGMPEMGGAELGRHLLEERPGLPILYISGYGDADTVTPLLRKPFAPDVLVRKVEELLERVSR